jgi:hypothetical protein
MSALATVRCVRCLKNKATHFCGHVTKGALELGAGWCDGCDEESFVHPPGWLGHWIPTMGEQRWPS